jgi:rRNA pseudouridine-1189 N-methylase Emg1 (Nep1/Mra1 family)
MDLATRKNRFIEQFEKIKDANLVERFETLLKNELNQNEIVAFSIDGNPISKKEYINRNEKAVASFKKGQFKTQKEILEKYKKGI